jgi:alginate O-acetyltransferase complex protein AlgI
MFFCSEPFLRFFLIVFAAYWALPWQRVRVWLLLGASFYFYASWNRWLALLIALTSSLDFVLAIGLETCRAQPRRKLLLALSLTVNLGLLAAFKYADFFIASLGDLLRAGGFSPSLPLLRMVLPVGISFYTFEAISYTLDVYRGRLRAERNLAHFLLFITFFPHLVAGPIVRAKDFLPQVRRTKRWDWSRLELGARFFLLGLFKKLAIADRMSAYADPVFAAPESFGTHAAWVATLAYALQIYCDFSGYSDMAIGCAHAFGYKLSTNFNLPYLASNVSDFWRRWHISLSTWLRDYLFIPLGGSHGSRWQTSRNLLLTMVLGGLWHGASWTFAAWGLYHGLLLVAHRGLRDAASRSPRLQRVLSTGPGRMASVALTFACVCIGWVFFRAPTFAGAATLLGRLAVPRPGASLPAPAEGFWLTVAAVVLCHALAARGGWKRVEARLPAPMVGFGYATVLMIALLLAPSSIKPFVYFQF